MTTAIPSDQAERDNEEATVETAASLPALPKVSISALSAVKAEGNGGTTAFTFSVDLDRPSSSAQTVVWQIYSGFANGSVESDFAPGTSFQGTPVTFAAGETSKVITVDVLGDTVVEPDERFQVYLHSPTSGLEIGAAAVTAKILDDESPIVWVEVVSPSQREGNGDGATFEVSVNLSHPATHLEIHSATIGLYSSAGGDPVSDASDFEFPYSFYLAFFDPGETKQTVFIKVVGDDKVEADELFGIGLIDIGSRDFIGDFVLRTILNDDASLSISASSSTIAEGNNGASAFDLTLTRTGDVSVVHSVAWSVRGSGANPAAASDFAGGLLPSGVVTFAAGEVAKTITVQVAGDLTPEAEEGFTVEFSAPSSGLTLDAGVFTASIVNDDRAVSVVASTPAKAEGSGTTTSFEFTVTHGGDAGMSHSVSWEVIGVGPHPASAGDFVGKALPKGIVTFAPGVTSRAIVVAVAGDNAVDPDEEFAVKLFAPSAGLTLGFATANSTIVNDDTVPTRLRGDAYVVLQGHSLDVPATSGVLANDENPVWPLLNYGAYRGAMNLSDDGSFSYVPSPEYSGRDFFGYSDGNQGEFGGVDVDLYVVPVSVGTTTTLKLLALGASEQVAATYVAFFGRAADKGGFGFWLNEFNAGLPTQGPAALFANIASSFGVSPEAKALYPFLANPHTASDGQISTFLKKVYDNLFDRTPDTGGLGYWTGQIKQTLEGGGFVGSVLVDILSGAQDTADSKDITTLMSKVAVSLAYVQQQQRHAMAWNGAADIAAATDLLNGVTADPLSVLIGIREAETIVTAHA